MEEEKERKERNEVDANIETNKYDESELQADNFDKYSTTKNHHAFKLHPIILFSFVILIAFNITIILTMKYKPELFNFSNGSLENYSSLDDLYKNSALAESIGLKIPSSLLSDKKEDFQIREVYGSMVEISNQETFVLKGSYYVDIHADPLGFYDVCEEDKEYIISEENKNDDLQYDAIL